MTGTSPVRADAWPSTRREPALRFAAALAALTLVFYSVRLVAFLSSFFAPELSPILAERDFANYWMAGHLAVSGEQQLLFSQEAYLTHLREVFGAHYQIHSWSYPPHFLLFVWPLGLLQYKAALVAFLLSTGSLFAAAVATFRRNFAADSRATVLMLALSAYVLIMTLAAQNGFLTAAELLFGLAWMKQRPVLAGLAFACLTVKPQLGLLIPVLLLFDRNWRVVAWSACFSALLVAASAAVFGLASWQAYLSETLVYQRHVMTEWNGSFLAMMPTAFGSLRTLGFSPTMAAAVQWPVSIVGAAMVLWLLWREADPLRRAFIVACGIFLITPYAFDYDMGALTAVAAILAGSDRRPASRLGVNVLTLIAMLAAVVTNLGRLHLPFTPLILAAGLAVMVAEARRGAESSIESPEPRTASCA